MLWSKGCLLAKQQEALGVYQHYTQVYIYIIYVYIYIFIYLRNHIDSRCASLGVAANGIFFVTSRVPETSIIWGIESLLTLFDRRKDQMDRITSPCAMLLHSWGAGLVPVVVIFNVMQAVKRVMNGSR